MSRILPDHPNLDHLKREAKALLKSLGNGETENCDVLRHLHRFSDATDDEILAAEVSLTEMQFALAMDYGFVSWQSLRQNVLERQLSSDSADEAVSRIFRNAARSGASDIHIEPMASGYRVRFRSDGQIRDSESLSLEVGAEIGLRLKQLAGLDTSETRLPQDGRFLWQLSKNRSIEFRIAILPVVSGEKITCRIVDPALTKVPIDQLGYDADQLALLSDSLNQSTGLVLFAGPIGSGKTVSLYTALSQLDSAKLNICTVEDPVEVVINGINQRPVNASKGMDFASTLSSVLSADPEVVMISELPDAATIRMALKAAHRGNLVLSSLETNSAPETLTFLKRQGVHTHYLANTIRLIVAQRLVRRLCTHCRQPSQLSGEQWIEAGFPADDLTETRQVFSPSGCEHCNDGYRGRISIFEVVKVAGKVSETVLAGGNSYDIAEACHKAGFANLVQSGLKKVLEGVTSLDELRRVTGR